MMFAAFGLVGAMMTLFGAFAYWWDSSMRPDHRSASLLVCGVLTLLSQAVKAFKDTFDDEREP